MTEALRDRGHPRHSHCRGTRPPVLRADADTTPVSLAVWERRPLPRRVQERARHRLGQVL